ncbi:hypothetical protein [Myceligenerans pegani]|uniref:AbiEi antitoxin C-terminal domain-containing protein n=1 Tax=Myceligenerans pegani TaxID=2776917 RepID=A0ABR9N0J1_9MICO|nr:hypothetical protein [Myceligenerans sp. TRM 65318]MBE1876756.1 hypothetical protein [Myceligenerans sp. TRM 65318]MBE3019027.1 hypothetical protein [Myceligenerans sp. TRM 65318]
MRLAQLLDPRPAPVPPVVTPARVGGPAAWQDLLRSGALTPLRDAPLDTTGAVAVPAGVRVTPTHRALVLAESCGGVLPARAVLAGASAAWVHSGLRGGIHVPRLPTDAGFPELAHDAAVRRPDVPAGVLVRCAAGLVRDTMLLAGVPVTTPARTAADVACRLPFEQAVPVLTALAAGSADLDPVDLDAVERALEARRRVVGRPAARRALAAARGQRPGAPSPRRSLVE